MDPDPTTTPRRPAPGHHPGRRPAVADGDEQSARAGGRHTGSHRAQLRAMAPERPPASRIRRGWPPSSKPIPSALARASHWALYALMLALPLTGWAMQGAAGLPVRVGGVVLPALVDADLARYGLLRELHAWLAYGLLALVLGHAGAALHHAWVRRDGVFEHMTLGRHRCD
ncbi:cytochrome b/b6 domain-containing protein [Luteimonas sp. Sa2BVA3]|uniref:Cytochrome b/b6 domain-containing protein n=2 Tax=Luteimonas colneyensis TaxID=2762230 RepID=A0ABR8UL09_9GAMM|nr:cytochrome b/b6 domain-containing protein [Luteimonas colneyensis]